MKRNFWKKKKVLITGHSGFTGTWVTSLLLLLKCNIVGISLKPNPKLKIDKNNFVKKGLKNYYFDIRDEIKLKKVVIKENPDIVIHLAAQSLIEKGISFPSKTFTTNINGTINLLNSLRSCKKLRSIMIFTTDKVYKNLEKKNMFKENDPLGGDDPYSSSKASKELIANSFSKMYFSKKKVGLITIRSGNIIGGGDWGENRLIPDLIRFNFEKKKISIRSLNSVRPWHHILDVLNSITTSVERLYQNYKLSGAYNIGPKKQGISVKEVIKESKLKYPKNTKKMKRFEEKKYLFLNADKFSKIFKIKTNVNFKDSIKLTINWYKRYYKKEKLNSIINDDLKNYFNL